MFWFLLGLVLYFLLLRSERALIGVSPHDLELLDADPAPAAQRAGRLVRAIRPALAALLLARLLILVLTVVGTSAWWMGQTLVRNLRYGADLPGWQGTTFWLLIISAWVAVISLLFWGLYQLNFRRIKPEPNLLTLKRLGRFITFWQTIFSPLLRVEKAQTQELETSDDPLSVAEITIANGEKREMELLRSIVKFGDVTVKQVMKPRAKVVGIEFSTHFQEVLDIVRSSEFSRLPVYDDDLDNVTGILFVKDLVPHLDKPADFEWQPLIRTNVLLAPESKRCSELLQEFKQQKIHLAVVVDEYGGTSGIVTMEDILEEVTGDIRDEFDEESDIRYRKLDEYNYVFEGQTLLNDVCRVTGLDSGTFDAVRGNADTLAGLALELRGDIPKLGAEIAWKGFLLTVIAADNRRIGQLKLTLESGNQLATVEKGSKKSGSTG
ncbi:MAG: CBS domain-containing protein [Saprospiraceae bacterium]